MEELISLFCYQTLDFPKLTLLHKNLKAAKLAMVDGIVLNHTNIELLAANNYTKKTTSSMYGYLIRWSRSSPMSLEDIEKNRQLAENKKKEKESKS